MDGPWKEGPHLFSRLYSLRDRDTERLSRSYPSVHCPSNPPAWKGSFEGSRDYELVHHLASRSSASSGSSRFAMIPPCKLALTHERSRDRLRIELLASEATGKAVELRRGVQGSEPW